MASLPSTMKAWTFSKPGKPKDVLTLHTNVPLPGPPRTGEVLIKISYVSLNPGDLHLMGFWIPFRRKTATPGMECVGEVLQIGPLASKATTHLRIGMTVAASAPFWSILSGAGLLAEYAVLPQNLVVQKPSALEEAVAAGVLGIAGQTAALVQQTANLREGDKVLLNGASGGVGSILVQSLSGLGARVTGICSGQNSAFVSRLGAAEVIDYKTQEDLCAHLSAIVNESGEHRPFDAVIDCVGDNLLYYGSPGYLNHDGKFVTIAGSSFMQLKSNYLPAIFGGMNRTYKSLWLQPSGDFARTVIGWVDKGWIKEIPVDSVFSMDDAVKAFERQRTGRAVGKIFVKVR